MKRKIRLYCAAFLLFMAFWVQPVTVVYGVSNATGSVSLSVSGEKTPGGIIKVPVVLKTSTVVSGIDITVSYPSNLVTFVKDSSSFPSKDYDFELHANGTIQIVNFRMEVQANTPFTLGTLAFKIKDGTIGQSGNFSVTAADVVDHLQDEDTFYPTKGSASVTVVAPKSANANLASLTVSRGKLSPAFSAGQTSYNVTVPNDVQSITIAAQAADGKATVTVKGNPKLTVGSNNKFEIVVTAENGTTKTYTVTVTRQGANTPAPVSSASPSPAPPASSEEPVSSEEAVSSEEPVSSEEASSVPAESQSVSSENVSSQPPQGQRRDYTWMTPHILYISGMLICLAVGAAFGYFFRGKRQE